jgi:hypothetical protein
MVEHDRVWTLGAKQRLFSRLLPRLLDRIHGEGYECTMAEGYVGLSIDKATEDTPHLRDGGHFNKLAQDIDLFKFNAQTFRFDYLTQTADHQQFGEFWESLHELCRWGGRFSDGNHYSIEHGGVK